jgi:hypothetical protein
MISQGHGRHIVKGLEQQLQELKSPVAPPPGIRTRRIGKTLKRTNGRCVWCSRSLRVGDMYLSAEHLIALGDGGRDIEANLLPACTPCNHQRGSCSIQEWIGHCARAGHVVQFAAIENSLRRQCKVASSGGRAMQELGYFLQAYGKHLLPEQVAEIEIECVFTSPIPKSIRFQDRSLSIGYTRRHAVLISYQGDHGTREVFFDAVRFFEGMLTPETKEIHLVGSNQHSLTIRHSSGGITLALTDWRYAPDEYYQYFPSGASSASLLEKWCRKYRGVHHTALETLPMNDRRLDKSVSGIVQSEYAPFHALEFVRELFGCCAGSCGAGSQTPTGGHL